MKLLFSIYLLLARAAPGAQRVEITENRLKRLYQTGLRVHGEKFAKKSVAHGRRLGYISPIQRYFGLHYRADMALETISRSSDYLKVLEKQGFNICEDYEPSKNK